MEKTRYSTTLHCPSRCAFIQPVTDRSIKSFTRLKPPVSKMPLQISATHVPQTAVQQRVRASNAPVIPPKPLSITQRIGKAALAAGLAASLTMAPGPALADLNKFEYNAGGEFGVGTALQYGEADLKGRDFHNQDLTRSNFTAADCRNCDFRYVGVGGVHWRGCGL